MTITEEDTQSACIALCEEIHLLEGRTAFFILPP